MAGLLWVEALAALAAAVGLLVVVARGSELAAPSVALAILSVGLAGLLVVAARALLGARRWARSPVITVQVILVAMAIGSWRTGAGPWPAVAVAIGVAVVVGLLLPKAVAWTVATHAPADATSQDGRGPGPNRDVAKGRRPGRTAP